MFESPIQGLGEKRGPVISVAGFLEVQNRTRIRAISEDLRWDGWGYVEGELVGGEGRMIKKYQDMKQG